MNSTIVHDILALASRNMRKLGWWGMNPQRTVKYSHKIQSNCECAALHIVKAAEALGATYADRLAALDAFSSVITVPADVANASDPWVRVTRWNDVSTRHVATVKRAFDRAVAKTA